MRDEAAYPSAAAEREGWVTNLRGPRSRLAPEKPHAFFVENERSETSEIVPIATIFLTNRECPWKCVMCDLWRNTTTTPVAEGAIRRQIEYALERLPRARAIKLYNSGSFFDHGAVRKSEHKSIAGLCRGFERVIVECHPKLIGSETLEFQQMLGRKLEIAMGLETANPEALEKINKRITLRDFEHAAGFLQNNEIALRTFLLVHPPFISKPERSEWLKKSILFAVDCASSVVSLIPTRAGNGAMEALHRMGEFEQPTLAELEHGLEFGVALGRGRVFADVWDLKHFSECGDCFESRRDRIRRMNLHQEREERIACHCLDEQAG